MKMIKQLLVLLFLATTANAQMAPVLTYYTYNSGNPSQPYSGEIVYNPILNEVWMGYTLFNPNDNLVRVKNYATIGDIAGLSTLVASPNVSLVGWTIIFDTDTNSAIFYKSSGGNKLLKVDGTTTVVTQITPSGALFTAAYNPYGAVNAKYFAFRSPATQIDIVNLAAGTSSIWTNTPPPGETLFSSSLVFSSNGHGWMMRQFAAPNKLDELSAAGAILNTYTVPGAVTAAQWLAYCPVNNSVYIAAQTTNNSAPKWLVRFDINTTTFTTVWTDPNPNKHRWFNSTDSAPILNYDAARNLIWFNDDFDASSLDGTIVGFSCATDTELYRFYPVFSNTPDNSTAPWKYVFAADSVWVSENNNAQIQQLLRISFPGSSGGSGGQGSSLKTWHKANTLTPWPVQHPGKPPNLNKLALFKNLDRRVKLGQPLDDALGDLTGKKKIEPTRLEEKKKPVDLSAIVRALRNLH